jgi:ligand-binding sensor domain-containing protein
VFLPMRRPQWSRKWLLLTALPAVLALGAAAFVFIRAQHSLNRAGTTVTQRGRFPVDLINPGLRENPGFEAIASPVTYASGAFYQGKLYVSGPSGLFVYGADSTRGGIGDALLKSYRVGLDLPAAPLGQMVVGRLRGASEPELIIATAGEGVLLFTGNGSADGAGTFRQIRPRNSSENANENNNAGADARDVTALLPLPTGELLIGTRRRGLLVYRGLGYLEIFHPQLADLAVTTLAADATGFWVGTRNQGLRHWHGGEIDSFEASASAASGPLPDNQIDALAVDANKVYAGTPLGVEEFVDGRPARLLAKNLFAHALFADARGLTIGTMDDGGQGIRKVSLEAVHRPGAIASDFSSSDEESAGPAEQFLSTGSDTAEHELFAILRDSLRHEQSNGRWTPLIADTSSQPGKASGLALTDGNISALAFGPDGRLWVGYFDRGLDILDIAASNGSRTEHREDDHLFCINRIALDPRRKTMAVATANGLVLFDQQNRPRQVMTRRDGLIADHVTDIAFITDTMVLATPAGLTFVDAAGARSLYAFEGLVNNHVYALGVQPQSSEILAGTLGGISILTQEAVRRNLTTANSGLKHNWITAIVPLSNSGSKGTSEDAWMVGTYGAGVMRLDGNGNFTGMEGVTRSMVVNPNAMLSTVDHIFAGTMGHGLWVCSRSTGRWKQITAGLPSENVTALADHQGEIYVGTENGLVRIAEHLLE